MIKTNYISDKMKQKTPSQLKSDRYFKIVIMQTKGKILTQNSSSEVTAPGGWGLWGIFPFGTIFFIVFNIKEKDHYYFKVTCLFK